ncbi:MAG: sigma-70 family RNA polymerase sigma factor [Candidatus Korobacteraceae bacterium]|jgi:RNA polymerase sigma-70 factor (ECF subfamily)
MEQLTATVMENAKQITGFIVAEFENFDSLVLAEQRCIYRVLPTMLRDSDAADNLTQECFLKAYEQRKRFRGECSVRTWLVRIAVNLARDHVKSRHRQFWHSLFSASDGSAELLEQVAPHASPERSLLARERLAHVFAVVEYLPEQQRAVFVTRFMEEMSTEEIAMAMSLRPATVRTHLYRALSAIKGHRKERKAR